MLYTGFSSASEIHLKWLSSNIETLYKLKGAIKNHGKCYQLRYAKNSSIKLLARLYYKKNIICLSRKYLKIRVALGIIEKRRGAEMVYRLD